MDEDIKATTSGGVEPAPVKGIHNYKAHYQFPNNGTVTIHPKHAEEGEILSVTVTPDAGKISFWSVDAMEWAVANKILLSGNCCLNPTDHASCTIM